MSQKVCSLLWDVAENHRATRCLFVVFSELNISNQQRSHTFVNCDKTSPLWCFICLLLDVKLRGFTCSWTVSDCSFFLLRRIAASLCTVLWCLYSLCCSASLQGVENPDWLINITCSMMSASMLCLSEMSRFNISACISPSCDASGRSVQVLQCQEISFHTYYKRLTIKHNTETEKTQMKTLLYFSIQLRALDIKTIFWDNGIKGQSVEFLSLKFDFCYHIFDF